MAYAFTTKGSVDPQSKLTVGGSTPASKALTAAQIENANRLGLRSNIRIDSSGQVAQKPPTVQTPAPTPTQQPIQQQTPGYVAPPQTYKEPESKPLAIFTSTAPGMIEATPHSTKENTSPASQTTPQTYPGIISEYQERARSGSEAVQKARQAITDFERSVAGTTAGIYSQPVSAKVMQGRDAQVQLANAKTREALQKNLENALAEEGLLLGSYGQIAGLVQPSVAEYGKTVFNPLTGTFTGGGSLTPEQSATTYAEDVIAGRRTYEDAVNAMGTFGNIGKQVLDETIRSRNPGFNFAQAQALARTQGEIAPSLNMAQEALNNLNNVFSTLPAWQKTGIPALNSLANALSQVGVGTGSATAKGNAINEARTQVANALGTMTNTTPTAWSAMVEEWFPNNATPEQIAAGIQQFQALAESRQKIFGTPGAVSEFKPNTSTKGGSNSFSTVAADGNSYTFYQDENGKWVAQ